MKGKPTSLSVQLHKLSKLNWISSYFLNRDLPVFIAMGIIGMFGSQLMYILGVYYTTADTAAIFQPLAPVWTTLIAILTKTEKLPQLNKLRGWAKTLGILFATGGAVTVTLVRKGQGSPNTSDKSSTDLFIGYIFLLGNTFTMGAYIVIQKKFVFNKPDYNWGKFPVTLTAWTYFFGFVTMSFATLYYVHTPERYTNIPIQTVYPLIYAIFITSAMCYLLISWCNMQIHSSVVTASWPLQTLFAVVISYFVLGEVMQALQYFGSGLIIFGLLCVIWANYQEEKDIIEKLRINSIIEDYGRPLLVDTDEEFDAFPGSDNQNS